LLISELGGGGRSLSGSDCLTVRKRDDVTPLMLGWVVPEQICKFFEERTFFAFTGFRTHILQSLAKSD